MSADDWADQDWQAQPFPQGRSEYRPGQARIGDATPQTHPNLFSVEDIRAEAKYLLGLNRRYGSNVLRTLAYGDLLRIADERTS